MFIYISYEHGKQGFVRIYARTASVNLFFTINTTFQVLSTLLFTQTKTPRYRNLVSGSLYEPK